MPILILAALVFLFMVAWPVALGLIGLLVAEWKLVLFIIAVCAVVALFETRPEDKR